MTNTREQLFDDLAKLIKERELERQVVDKAVRLKFIELAEKTTESTSDNSQYTWDIKGQKNSEEDKK